MTTQIDQAGAMPDTAGATPATAGQAGSAGATPSSTSTPAAGATAAAAGSQDATSRGYPDGLGDAGKRALDAERDAREAAETKARDAHAELDKIRRANQSEAEKAIEAARTEGWSKATDIIRRSEVRRALTAAGCRFVDLAAKADEFASLEVTDSGAVKDLERVVERFKSGNPDAFTAAGRPADSGLGPRGQAPGSAHDMNDLIRRAAGRQQ